MHEKITKYLQMLERNKWIFIILLMMILYFSVSVRMQPVPNLIDQTSGEPIPSALDPFYFERSSEHLLDGGSLNDIDDMRYLGVGGYSSELLSYSNVYIYKLVSVFYDVEFSYFHIISPVIYFALSIIIFYMLGLRLFRNRLASILATACLAFSPLFLGRTTAGFADHESIGVMFFLLSLYFLADFFSRGDKNMWWRLSRKYLLFPLMMALTLYSWGGIGRILLIIYPLFFAFLTIRQIVLRRHYDFDPKEDLLFLQDFMIILGVLGVIGVIAGAMGGLPVGILLSSYVLSTTGIFIQFNVAYFIIAHIIMYIPTKKWDKALVSFVATAIVGLIGMIATGKIKMLIAFIKSPFIRGRVGLTVAENQPISLLDLQANAGVFFTVMFIVGAILILSTIVTLVFNWKKRNGIPPSFNYRYMFMLTLLITVLYSLNSSIRLMFINSIFLSMFVGIVISQLFNAYIRSTDKAAKMLGASVFVFCLIITIFSAYSFYVISDLQTKTIGPSANQDWQNAMEWTRDNTPEDSLFIHWWDYGYWVQSLGERATVTDGGHAISYWDHLIGRYLLTTPNEASAFAMFNTYGVDYFLVDSSDIGKYPAYSSIGDGPDEKDRSAQIGVFAMDPTNTQETANSTTYIYSGQMMFDEDYIYDGSGILPAGKSAVVQIQITIDNFGSFKQMQGIAATSTSQVGVPINYRYLYFNNELFDLGEGYEGVVRMIPSYTSQGSANAFGGALVMTPRVANSFFAKTYILNQYDDSPFIEVAYQGPMYGGTDKFILYGGRIIGPITIYKVNENPYGTNYKFLESKGPYGALDNDYYTE